VARPFLKWAGGKRRLLAQYRPYFPSGFARYHEPFVGSAAVFFELEPADALLADSNAALIQCYAVARDHVEALILRLERLQARHSRRTFYEMRDRYNGARLDPIERAALFIYLNRTCYNGLYRVNSRGHFNVPAGRYVRPRIADPDGLRAASAALRRCRLVSRRFDRCFDDVRRGDFVYIDPPYHRLQAASFTSYTAEGFGEAEQRELATLVDRLHATGCRVMVSNSDTALIRELYSAYRIIPIRAARAINSSPGGRGPVGEVLVVNY
jgi:DNA adenine methylase